MFGEAGSASEVSRLRRGIKPRKIDERLYTSHGHGGETGSRQGAVRPGADWPLHPDAGDLSDPGRRRRRTGPEIIQLTNALKVLLKRKKQMIYALELSGTLHGRGRTVLGFLKTTVEFALRRPDVAPGQRLPSGLNLDSAETFFSAQLCARDAQPRYGRKKETVR